jgi:ABC-type sugar transport system substrate-binding protein
MEKASIQRKIGARAAALLAAALLAAAPGAARASASTLDLDVRPENRTILIPGPGNGTVQIQVTPPTTRPPVAGRT